MLCGKGLDRTQNLWIPSPVLCQLHYEPDMLHQELISLNKRLCSPIFADSTTEGRDSGLTPEARAHGLWQQTNPQRLITDITLVFLPSNGNASVGKRYVRNSESTCFEPTCFKPINIKCLGSVNCRRPPGQPDPTATIKAKEAASYSVCHTCT